MKQTYAASLGFAAAKDGRRLTDNPYRSRGNVSAYGKHRAGQLADQWEEGWRCYAEEVAKR